MRKSISGFILGLLGSLACLAVSLGYLLVGAVTDGTEAISLVTIFGWMAFAGSILGIIGSAFCFKKARTAGVILLFAFLLCATCKVYGFIVSGFADYLTTSFGILSLVFAILPLFLLFIASICALSARKTRKVFPKHYSYNR